jgi:translation initiation factor IF-2
VVVTRDGELGPELESIAQNRKLPILRSEGEDFESILKFIAESLAFTEPVSVPELVDRQAVVYAKEKKRTDVLVEAEKPPTASGIILDVEKSASQGTTALLLVKRGTVRRGQYFVAGSGFGKVVNIWTVSGESIELAKPGSVVKVGRIVKNAEYTGDFAPDDFLHVFTRERAWRLAFQRQRIEWLNSFQTSGQPLVAPFELDSALVNRKSHAEEVDRESVGPSKEWLRDAVESRSILVEPAPEAVARAKAESARVTARWTRRQEIKKRAREEAEKSAHEERMHLHNLRMQIHGKTGSVPHTNVPAVVEEKLEGLPERAPVIPLIVKTGSVSDFDSVLDELETLERTFGVKLPVVHGGIGPVSATDIVHAEIESKFSPCRVFSIKTSVLPDIDTSRVDQLGSIAELVAEVRWRIVGLKSKARRASYARSLELPR